MGDDDVARIFISPETYDTLIGAGLLTKETADKMHIEMRKLHYAEVKVIMELAEAVLKTISGHFRPKEIADIWFIVSETINLTVRFDKMTPEKKLEILRIMMADKAKRTMEAARKDTDKKDGSVDIPVN